MPDEYYKYLSEINIKDLKRISIAGIIFDIDQTLALYRTTKIPKHIGKTVKNFKKHFRVCAVSNYNADTKERRKRDRELTKKLGIRIIHTKRKKPHPEPYIKCMKYLRTSIDNTVIIGNSHIGDVIGAKKIGLYAILVKPLKEQSPFHIKIINFFENLLFWIYKS